MTDSSTRTGSSLSKPSTSESDPSVPEDHGAKELKAAVVTGAHDVGDGVMHLAKDITASTKKGAESQINNGKTRIVDGLGSVAGALRKTGEQLGDDDKEMLTGYLDTAADKIEDASDYLKNRSLSNLAGDLKQFARREPALFLGGGLILGLVAGRFLKSATPSAPADGVPSTQRMWQQESRPNGSRSPQMQAGSLGASRPAAKPMGGGNMPNGVPSSRTDGARGVGQT